VDVDVHHGDGTQALFWDDPQVATVSIHESGQFLFPGTGEIHERGGPGAPGSAVNVPLGAWTGDASWQEAVTSVVPAVAERVRPTILVSQQGCDSHALDPLANLRVTTRSYAVTCRLLDELSRRWCEGRWLATGGGGYDAYRVVPRSWALIWLAQAGRPVPPETPPDWRDRWELDAERFGQSPMPVRFLDRDDLVGREPAGVAERNRRTIDAVLAQVASAD
jgi:acetoin utilization protein AcuC